MKLKNFVLSLNSSVTEAMHKIELNKMGFVLLHDENERIQGICTDGDIRRSLINGSSMFDTISHCANFNFVKAQHNTPNEILLKQLDNEIKVIPVLDDEGKLISIITKDSIPIRNENRVFARSKSPVRISFGGGGSDTSAYFSLNRAAVINTTISLYAHSTLKLRDDSKIVLNSLDLNDKIEFENFVELKKYDGKFNLIKAVIETIDPSFGFELFVNSDFPMSSGLGGSAAVVSSIIGCFNQFRNDKWDRYEISEIAFQAERLSLGVAGGWQDQYATVFGGFNFMEFNEHQNIINPIRLNNEIILELEECLILCYTGINHDSGKIHKDQKKQTEKDGVKARIQLNVDISFEMRNHLLRGRLNDFGQSLHKSWELKRSFSTKISTPFIDEIYEGAIKNGAIGGKILGAGGGGYFLFYVPSIKRHRLINWIISKGLSVTPFVFEDKGLQSWKVREID
jgi:D-glycero-alpha-D-manno-heptose-7-phosphate kinase